MSSLLVNADDWGLLPDINKGIADCVENGPVRSLSVVANGSAPDWARLREWQSGGVKVGVHLTLVGEPWLTGGATIGKWPALVARLARGGRGFAESAGKEIEAQVARCEGSGLKPAHLDSHQHAHVLPGIWERVVALARAHGIGRVRIPVAASWKGVRKTPGGVMLQLAAARRLSERPGERVCLGLRRSGSNTLETFGEELRGAAGRDAEMVAHPGITTGAVLEKYGHWGYDWSGERELLLDKRFLDTAASAGYDSGLSG